MTKAEIYGWLVYMPLDEWREGVTVEDADGTPMTLDALKAFHGLPVRLVVDVVPDLEPSGPVETATRVGRDIERAELLDQKRTGKVTLALIVIVVWIVVGAALGMVLGYFMKDGN